MGQVRVTPAARRDLLRHFAYLAENGSLTAARRFLAAAYATLEKLAQMPRIGARREIGGLHLRMWAVQHFRKYLIFYKTVGEEVEIVRIIHAAQDYHRVLDRE